MKARRLPPWSAFAIVIACAFVAPTASAQKPPAKPPAKDAAPAKPAPAKPAAAPAAKPAAKPPGKPSGKDPGKPESAGASTSSKGGKPDPARPATAHQVVERESRIEFDERMVRGQSAAGAIYLFQRSPSEFKSIVNVPETFRPRTVALITPRKGSP